MSIKELYSLLISKYKSEFNIDFNDVDNKIFDGLCRIIEQSTNIWHDADSPLDEISVIVNRLYCIKSSAKNIAEYEDMFDYIEDKSYVVTELKFKLDEVVEGVELIMFDSGNKNITWHYNPEY